MNPATRASAANSMGSADPGGRERVRRPGALALARAHADEALRAGPHVDGVTAGGEVVVDVRVGGRRRRVILRRHQGRADAEELPAGVILIAHHGHPAVLVEVEGALAVDVALAGLELGLDD